MEIINTTKNTILGNKIKTANNFKKRLIGLIPKKYLNENEGLVITPCKSIHTFFMKFSIDVLFIDKNDKVIYILEKLRPWRISKYISNSLYVVELPAGTIKRTKTQVNDQIKING